jgi:hypothetical protein
MKTGPRSATNIATGSSAPDQPSAQVVRKILEVIATVQYGSVEIVIQDARVVQIERKEKFRFDKS